jgi:hypothetical protein
MLQGTMEANESPQRVVVEKVSLGSKKLFTEDAGAY